MDRGRGAAGEGCRSAAAGRLLTSEWRCRNWRMAGLSGRLLVGKFLEGVAKESCSLGYLQRPGC
jgi:hypothetical protein